MAGTYRYTIEPRDVDSSLRARIYTMGDHILQAANDDADMLGFGVRDLNAGVGSAGVEASWVLSRMAIEMRRMPRRHEQIGVYTWVSDYGRVMTTRNMVITDGEGVEIGAAVTQWAMIDLSTRRPLDLSALSNKSTSLVDRQPPVEKPHKVGALGRRVGGEEDGGENVAETTHKVAYSDIDFNGHAGSMKYVEWMVDTLPAGTLARAEALRLDINYLHEARQGDRLTIRSGTGPEGVLIFDISDGAENSICRASLALG